MISATRPLPINCNSENIRLFLIHRHLKKYSTSRIPGMLVERPCPALLGEILILSEMEDSRGIRTAGFEDILFRRKLWR